VDFAEMTEMENRNRKWNGKKKWKREYRKTLCWL